MSAARTLLITSEPKEACGLRAVSTQRTSPEARSISARQWSWCPGRWQSRGRLPCAGIPELSVRISMCHWPHSRTAASSMRRAGEPPSWVKFRLGENGTAPDPVTLSDPEITRKAQPPQKACSAAWKFKTMLQERGLKLAHHEALLLGNRQWLQLNPYFFRAHIVSTMESPRVLANRGAGGNNQEIGLIPVSVHQTLEQAERAFEFLL